MNTIVRPLEARDLEWVIKIDQLFPHPWKESAWRNLSVAERCFVLEIEEKLVGYILFRHLAGAEDGHLLKIFMLEDARGTGGACELLKVSSDLLGLKEVFLEVGETNQRAQHFYIKMGFKKVHLARGFYSDGENAWIMTLTR